MAVEPAHPSARRGTLHGRVISPGSTPASPANIANIVTVVRILMVPTFIWALFADEQQMGPLRWIAAALFVIAIVTDSVDGHLARSRNLITDIGKILDPIADKVLIGGALVSLSVLGELPWAVTVIILVRELGITAFRFAVLRSRVIPASSGGKLKTVMQAIAISFFLVPLTAILGDWIGWLNAMLMAVALVLTVVTGIDYLWKAYRSDRQAPAQS